MSEPPPGTPRRGSGLAGLALLAALLVYTALVHHGVGPSRPGHEDRWYTPSNFMAASEFTYAMIDPPGVIAADELFQGIADRNGAQFDGWEASARP